MIILPEAKVCHAFLSQVNYIDGAQPNNGPEGPETPTQHPELLPPPPYDGAESEQNYL